MKLLHFYADDCAPCRTLAPILDKFLMTGVLPYSEHFDVDLNSSRKAAGKYNVMALPTVLIVDDRDKELARLTGWYGRSVKPLENLVEEAKKKEEKQDATRKKHSDPHVPVKGHSPRRRSPKKSD